MNVWKAESPGTTPYHGTDRLLLGIIMGVIAFWLFAQTTLNIAPDMQSDLGIDPNTMNIAVAITSLFSGIFIVVVGGLADRVGRLKITRIGFGLSIAGSLMVGITPAGDMAAPVLLLGRALQGLSAACIMPASLALVKVYWDGAERQRAVSMWSIGSWGGAGLCSLVGGLMSQNFGWRRFAATLPAGMPGTERRDQSGRTAAGSLPAAPFRLRRIETLRSACRLP